MKTKVKEVLATIFELEVNDISDDFKQENLADWDSLQHLNVMIALEEAFELSFEPDEIADMVTIDKIVDTIKAKK